MKTDETIGEFLVRLRRQRMKFQEEIADYSGISRKHLSDLENDKVLPNYDTIMRLARVLEFYPSSITEKIGKILDERYDEGDFPEVKDFPDGEDF